jgi:hypothetical protein
MSRGRAVTLIGMCLGLGALVLQFSLTISLRMSRGHDLPLADVLLHYVTPTLYVVWWLVFQSKGGLRWYLSWWLRSIRRSVALDETRLYFKRRSGALGPASRMSSPEGRSRHALECVAPPRAQMPAAPLAQPGGIG